MKKHFEMKIRYIIASVAVLLTSVELFATIEIPSYRIVSETKDDKATTLIVNYLSVSADGTSKDTVSGLISIPTSQPLAAILECHHTVASNQEVPSVKGETASAMLFRSIVCVIAPDYYGYGVTADKPHNYLCHEQNAANSIDLALVARDIFDIRNVTFDADVLFNFGYSQGGAVALAVHREMEENSELAEFLHFKKSYCGDGPYDVPATLETVLGSESLAMPVILPLVIKGFLTGYPQYFAAGREFADFFQTELIEAGLESWVDSKEYTTDQISEMMLKVTNGNSSLAAFLNPDLLDVNSALRKEIESVAELTTVLTDWEATYPLMFYHLKDDKVVPFVNAENAINALGLDEETLYVSTSYYDHVSFATMYYILAAVDMYNITEECKKNADAFLLPEAPSAVEEVSKNTFDVNAPFYDILGKPLMKDACHGVIFQNGQKFYIE